MIEAIVIILFISFGILPCVFNHSNMTYKDSFILGNGVVLVLVGFLLVLSIVVISFNHIIFGEISLSEVLTKLINDFK